MVKGLCLCLGEALGIFFIPDSKEVVGSGGGAWDSDSFEEFFKDFLCVFDHGYLCNAWLREFKIHAKVVMNSASTDNEAIAIYCSEIGCKLCDLKGVDVQCLKIINVPGDFHLGAIDGGIGNAGVIWVDDERGRV